MSLILGLILVPLMRPLAFRLGALDKGQGRRTHEGVIPRLGGVGIYLAFMIPMLFLLTCGKRDDLHGAITGILIGSTIVFLAGICDDLFNLSIRYKLLAEAAAAVLVYAMGIRIEGITNPFNGVVMLGWMALPVTVLWIVVITNAINLIDGMDGLAAGTVILITATLFFLSGAKNIHLQLTFLILIGSLIGFLSYNFPPASIFMGDSGSLFLGFFLGSLTIMSSQKATAMATMLLPVIAFSHPLTDMLYTILRRFHRGMPLGEADREHIHHKLLEKGMSKKKVLLLFYLTNTAIMVLVLVFIRRNYNINFILLAGMAAVGITGLYLFGYMGPAVLIRENLDIIRSNRRRRYFSYLIRKFKKDVAASRTGDEIRGHLTGLIKAYGFDYVEIRRNSGNLDGSPCYVYGVRKPECPNAIMLEFPLMSNQTKRGKAVLIMSINRENLLCTSELAAAISEVMGKKQGCND